jgi:hypothetical protein
MSRYHIYRKLHVYTYLPLFLDMPPQIQILLREETDRNVQRLGEKQPFSGKKETELLCIQ